MASTSGLSGTLGTSGGLISFPGVVSGIDYNSIIQALTKLSLEPTVGLNSQVATLNQANVELTKINNLLNCVQNSLENLSNPALFTAYGATSTDSLVATAQGISGESAVPGSYLIEKTQTATASSVTSSSTAGHSIADLLTSGPYAGQPSDTVPLADSYAAVTPTNGNGTLGHVTVNGVTVTYNVQSQSLLQILANIQSAVRGSGDLGFSATLVGNTVQFTDTDAPISLGSAGDTGNLLQVLQLSNAQLNNTSNSGSITGTAGVGGINPDASFDTTTNAGFVTPVTAGYFTINGAKITVNAGQNLNDIVNEINESSAGVVATINSATGAVILTATSTGPTGIVVGATGDTSNFLKAAGLTAASGANVQIGSQSEVDVLNSDGSTSKYFSNTNAVTTAIPGIQINLASSTDTPFAITVAQNTTSLVNAVQNFVCVYNAAVQEINAATAPPVVTSVQPGSTGQSQSFGGGVLYNDTTIEGIKNQLVSIVSGFFGGGSNDYNSLAQIGIQLSDQFSTFTTGNNTGTDGQTGGSALDSDTGSPVQQTTYEGTDGTLQDLNVGELLSAFTQSPNDVYSLLNGANGLTTQLGTYLTAATGAPTILDTGVVGIVPAVSLIHNDQTSNLDSISNLQQQIQQLTDNANAQANTLRAQFSASETLISELQSEQQELAAALGFTVSSNSSSG